MNSKILGVIFAVILVGGLLYQPVEANNAGIIAKRYVDLKGKALESLTKAGTAYLSIEPRYDTITGVRIDDVSQQVQLQDLETRKLELQEEIVAIDILISDINKME